MTERKGSRWFGAVAVAAFGALILAQRRRRLRPAMEDTDHHIARNLAIAGLAAAAINLAETPVIRPLAALVARRRLGLMYWLQDRFGFSDAVRDGLAVVLLDYTLYLWHVTEHKVPVLYRFHAVHHADLDLDVTTALRFHFGELVASVPWRAAQTAGIGVSPRALSVWQKLTFLSVMFHHSNVRLPIGVERAISRVIMTPRLHGIHHSIVQDEQDSNWSSGLTVWDFVHGTYRGNVPQADVTIGVAAFRDTEQVTLPEIVIMPFEHMPELDRLPDGNFPTGHAVPAPNDALALLP